MTDLRTIILAAGKGTRMKSETPKVLHNISGKPIISYVIETVLSIGSLKTYVVLGHQRKAVEAILPKEVTVVPQEKLLGTADAVMRTEKYLKSYQGNILIVCGDTPLLTKETLKSIIQKHKNQKAVCTVLTAVVPNPQGYGRILRDDNVKMVAIREDKDASGLEKEIAEINVGVYCFSSKELFEYLKRVKVNKKKGEFYITDIIALLAEAKLKIETVETEDFSEGLGVNHREDLAQAASVIRKRILSRLMLDGVTIVDPLTTYIDARVKIGQDTIIHPFTVIEGDVKIGRKCSIGPFARLRPGTKIADNVMVGNFAEVSRSSIGEKTLMKHFGFLGDASVGANANIGAGVVTANFDGKNKNQTKISDGAFIGSDAILVAPVSVGKKAMVGAGSVVTKGKKIPDNSIAVGMPARVLGRRKD